MGFGRMLGGFGGPTTAPLVALDPELPPWLNVQEAVEGLKTAVDALAAGAVYVGAYDVAADSVSFTSASGLASGALPPANAPGVLAGYYVICTADGTGTGNAPAVALRVGDQLLSSGPTGGPAWNVIPVGGQAYVPISGGIMTGPLILSGTPIFPMQAATKQYVDSLSLNAPSDGRAYGLLNDAWTPVVNLAGDMMTGTLAINRGLAPPAGPSIWITENGVLPNGGILLDATSPTSSAQIRLNTDQNQLFIEARGSQFGQIAIIVSDGMPLVFGVGPRASFIAALSIDLAGDVTAARDPVAPLGVATKQYVDAMTAVSAQTPWLSDVDGAGFNLGNVGMITARDIVSVQTIANVDAIGNVRTISFVDSITNVGSVDVTGEGYFYNGRPVGLRRYVIDKQAAALQFRIATFDARNGPNTFEANLAIHAPGGNDQLIDIESAEALPGNSGVGLLRVHNDATRAPSLIRGVRLYRVGTSETGALVIEPQPGAPAFTGFLEVRTVGEGVVVDETFSAIDTSGTGWGSIGTSNLGNGWFTFQSIEGAL
jgi:hypothetical protein